MFYSVVCYFWQCLFCLTLASILIRCQKIPTIGAQKALTLDYGSLLPGYWVICVVEAWLHLKLGFQCV